MTEKSKIEKRSDEADILVDMHLKEVLEEKGWEIISTSPIFNENKTTLQIWVKKEYVEKEREK